MAVNGQADYPLIITSSGLRGKVNSLTNRYQIAVLEDIGGAIDDGM
jgi:hypothetical protein